MCRRIENHIKELFVFVAHPEVPSDNNAAERSLRPLVVSRKVSGGTRSAAGTGTKMALASIFGTWRAQGLNPLAACQQLLASPQVCTVTIFFPGQSRFNLGKSVVSAPVVDTPLACGNLEPAAKPS